MTKLYTRPSSVNKDNISYVWVDETVYDVVMSLNQNHALVLLWLVANNRAKYVAEHKHKKRMQDGRKAILKERKRKHHRDSPKQQTDMASAGSTGYFFSKYDDRVLNKPITLRWDSVSNMLEEMGRTAKTQTRQWLRQTLVALHGAGHLDELQLPKRGSVSLKLGCAWAHGKQDLYVPLPHPLVLNNPLVLGLLFQSAAHGWFSKYPRKGLDPVALAQVCGHCGVRIEGRPKRAISLLQSAIKEINNKWMGHALQIDVVGSSITLGKHEMARDMWQAMLEC